MFVMACSPDRTCDNLLSFKVKIFECAGPSWYHRRFPEITGEDNLTVFSYSGRVKFPEWRQQWRRADLWQFEEPTIRSACSPQTVSAWSTFLMPFLPFVYGYPSSPHVLTVPPTKACLLCATPADMDLYIQVYACRHLLSAVPWISEDRLLSQIGTIIPD